MALQKTGYSKDTPQHYLLDSATLYTNLQYNASSGEFTGTLVGATDGGVELNIELKYRDISVDGTYWTPVLGNKALSSAVATAKASIKEMTVETIRMSLNGESQLAPVDEAPAGYTKITGKRYVEDTDYLPNVGFVGKITGSDDPIIIILDNCLLTTGADIKTKDDDEAVIECQFDAHASYEKLVADEFPWTIYYPTVKTLNQLAKPVVTPGTITSTSAKFDWDAVPQAQAYVFRYGVQGETANDRIYYTETNSYTLTQAIFAGDTSAVMAGKTLNVSVTALHSKYAGVGTNAVDRSIDAAQNALAREKDLVWSDIIQAGVPAP